MDEINNQEVFTEAYFGKTPGIIKIANAMDVLYKEMVKDPYKQHARTPYARDLERAIENNFGFQKVVINVSATPRLVVEIYNMLDCDRFTSAQDIIISKTRGYYDNKHMRTVVIQLSATVPMQYGLTSEEYTAFLLHEIGHSLDRTPYMGLRILLAIIQNPLRILTMQSGYLNRIANLKQALSNNISNIPFTKKLNEWFIQASDAIAKYTTPVYIIAAMSTLPLRIIPGYMNMLVNTPGRKAEEFADSFATSYGYGKELASGLTRIQNDKMATIETPLGRYIHDMSKVTTEIINAIGGDEHGTTSSRILSVLNKLEMDAKDNNFSPEMKSAMEKDIKSLHDAYDTILGVRDANPDVALKYTYEVRRFIDKIFHGNPHIFASRLKDFKVLPTEETKHKYYRYTVNGVDIYTALREAVGNDTWSELTRSPAFAWKPFPSTYVPNGITYFTEKGKELFESKSLPIIRKYINANIEKEAFISIGKIEYVDMYQVIAVGVPYPASTNEATEDIGPTDMEKIEGLLSHMSDFKYGFASNGRVFTGNILDKTDTFKRHYKLMSPEDVEKYKVCTCWDAVNYEAKWFDDNVPNIEYKCYYCEYEPNIGNSHTWIEFKHEGKSYVFEYTWAKKRGIKEVLPKNRNRYIDYVEDIPKHDHSPSDLRNGKWMLFSFDPHKDVAGTPLVKYMDDKWKHGKLEDHSKFKSPREDIQNIFQLDDDFAKIFFGKSDNAHLVTESFIDTTETLYHGSSNNIDGPIIPMGVDLGDSSRGPGWSTFCWNKREYGCRWAMYQGILNNVYRKYLRGKPNMYTPQIDNNVFINITQDTLDAVVPYLPVIAYVYEFEMPKSKISNGHTSSIREFAVREPVTNYRKIKITVTEDDIRKISVIIPDMGAYMHTKSQSRNWAFNRGLSSIKNTSESMINGDVLSAIMKAYRNGDIEIGDDISEWLSTANMEIRKLYPIDRIKLFLSNKNINESCKDIETARKSDSKYKFIDFPSIAAKEYLKDDKECGKYLNTLLRTSVGEVIVDTDKDKLAGYAFVYKAGKNKGFIYNIEVYPDYRRRGLGTTLLKDAITKFKGEDLTVRKNNDIAVNMYKKAGFVIIGDGNSKSEYYMKLKSKLTKDDVVEESTRYMYPMTESVIFNKQDIQRNLGKFKTGESNVMLITGYSGSGKSTLAEGLAKKYHCEYFELDILEFYIRKLITLDKIKTFEPALYDFITSHESEFTSYPGNLYEKYIPFVIDWCKRHPDKRYIIEGIQLYEIFDNKNPQEFYKDTPIIIRGTSGITSSARAAKRNEGNNLKNFMYLMGWVMKDAKLLNNISKYYTESSSAEELMKLQFARNKAAALSRLTGEKTVVRIGLHPMDGIPSQMLQPTDNAHNPNISNHINEHTFVVSDLHFGKYNEDYNEKMISMINSVPKTSPLLILGDIGYAKTENPDFPNELKEIFSRINHPDMYLVLGNHDLFTWDYYSSLGFKGVYDRITVPEKKWVFSHEPCIGPSDDYTNFHGHIHGETRYDKRIKDFSKNINCWVGYCNSRVYTINEWIKHNKLIDKNKVYFESTYMESDVMNMMSIVKSAELNDVYHNLDKWETGESNLMWITGLSGSGKSTISRELSDLYNAHYIELDKLQFAKMRNVEFIGHEVIDAYIKYMGGISNIFPYVNHLPNIGWKDIVVNDEIQCAEEFTRFFDFVIKYAATHKNKRFICEGVQIAFYANDNMTKNMSNYPVIIKMNGPLKAEFRREMRAIKYGMRDGESVRNIFNKVFSRIRNCIKSDFLKSDWDAVRKYKSSIVNY